MTNRRLSGLLLTGRASFVDDITLPGTLSAVFVRSPFAHAAVRKIDKSAALALPGVVAVYTLDDLRPHVTSDRTPLGQSVRELMGLATKSLRENIAPFILVRDEVCYVGDPVGSRHCRKPLCRRGCGRDSRG